LSSEEESLRLPTVYYTKQFPMRGKAGLTAGNVLPPLQIEEKKPEAA
jgi:hypothetical protein